MSEPTSLPPPALRPGEARPDAPTVAPLGAAPFDAPKHEFSEPRDLPTWHKDNAREPSKRANLLEQIEGFVRERLGSLPPYFRYHCIEHTEQVVSNAKVIADAEGIRGPLWDVLVASAWLHDVGIPEKYKGHEAVSVRIAREQLTGMFTEEELELTEQAIMATQIPQNPTHIIAKILCDADLFYLGTTLFMAWSERLREEYSHLFSRNYSNAEWAEVNINFMRSHRYYTRFASEYCGRGYEYNLRRIEEGHNESFGSI